MNDMPPPIVFPPPEKIQVKYPKPKPNPFAKAKIEKQAQSVPFNFKPSMLKYMTKRRTQLLAPVQKRITGAPVSGAK